jgi:DNA-nicking Smr family endonuclease
MQKKNVTDNNTLKSSLRHNPFYCLKGLVDLKDRPPSRPTHKASQMEGQPKSDPLPEGQLFLEAMEGVNPVIRDHFVGANIEMRFQERTQYIPENEALSQLVRLVNNGEGFIVSDTSEYIEGTGYNVHQKFAQRLHQGDYSIQAHIDLHGLNVESAKEVFESFLKASLNSGKRAVLIIHGRGLSSPGEPVLKNKVREWLSHSYWLKRMIAYASAQSHDGGAGATYVLLRNRPVSKRSGSTK